MLKRRLIIAVDAVPGARPEVILVIEDEPGIVDFLERGLAAHGFEVESALDGITGTARHWANGLIWSCST